MSIYVFINKCNGKQKQFLIHFNIKAGNHSLHDHLEIFFLIKRLITSTDNMSLVSDEEWDDFKLKFGKAYKDEVEEKMRRELYSKAKLTIDEHNKKYESGEVTWTMGINDMSDYTEEEYSRMCGFKPFK